MPWAARLFSLWVNTTISIILPGSDGEREGRVPDHGPERDQDLAAPQTREHRQPGKSAWLG